MDSARFSELFEELLGLGHEMQNVECKSPGPRTDRMLRTKVIKAMLGMANRRDGGYVLIGIADKAGSLEPLGLSPADLSTWTKYDDLASAVSEYADPSIAFESESHIFGEKGFVLITVKEFEDIPVICKKTSYNAELRQGGCYVRSRRKPETTVIPTQEDMRELLDLAAEKRVRKFIAQARSVGLDLTPERKASDDALFDHELGDFYRG